MADAVTNFEYSHITQNHNGRFCMQFNDFFFSRHSFSSVRKLSAMHHIFPIDPIYGLTRNHSSSLHTLPSIISADQSDRLVSKIKINPRLNIVPTNNIASQSGMDFDLNNI
ncbi:hypothetical protein RDI58_024086 [Solanum bulbocastanum]|uniref:Uncharacterized protein n=1 Tax=Solanum bulbocastanum TaxID=147425 RepID=A0AAN8Y2Z5_SOLBU